MLGLFSCVRGCLCVCLLHGLVFDLCVRVCACACYQVVRVNKREAGEDAPALTLANALWLATLGGAQVLSMQEVGGWVGG